MHAQLTKLVPAELQDFFRRVEEFGFKNADFSLALPRSMYILKTPATSPQEKIGIGLK